MKLLKIKSFYKVLAILLVFFNTNIQSNSAPILELTTENWKSQLQGKTVLVYFSLGCDIGSFTSQMFVEAMDELKGVYVSAFDVNSAYEMMQGKAYDLGSIALIKNGTVLESSEETYKDYHFLNGYNNQQIWVYNALKRNNIQFTMPYPGETRLEPKKDEGSVNLEHGLNAIYRFEGNTNDETGQRSEFNVRGVAKIKNNEFYCDGTYDGESGGQYVASDDYSTNVFKNGFAVHANIKVNSSEEQRKFVLSFGYRSFDFEINKDKLNFATSLYGNLGDDKYTYCDDFYPLTEVPLEYDKWMNIIISTDIFSRRMYVMINGKRYKDFNLSKRFVKFFNQYGMGYQGIRMHNYGWGGVLNGYADDFVVYERKINVSEMRALYNKYNKSGGSVSNNVVVDEPYSPNDNFYDNAFWKGEWTTGWGNTRFKTVINEFKGVVSGTYEYKNGVMQATTSIKNGVKVMEGTWKQSNSSGWFKFKMNSDGKSFKGEWGYKDNENPSGEWDGVRN